MAKDIAKAFAGMLKKEAEGTKYAGKPCKKPTKKGRK